MIRKVLQVVDLELVFEIALIRLFNRDGSVWAILKPRHRSVLVSEVKLLTREVVDDRI